MPGLSSDGIPKHLDGPAIAAAASGLMLLPQNASQLVRLHRFAALGASMANRDAPDASPSSIRAALKADDLGGHNVIGLEEDFSEPLVHSVTFYGGDYLVSGGSAEHGVADLENLLEAIFWGQSMPVAAREPARTLVQTLLWVSDTVLRRAGLSRGTAPEGGARTPLEIPGAARLKELTKATFISIEEMRDYANWMSGVVDTLAIDPGQLVDPCALDYNDDRLYKTPFLRLNGGYRVVLPLDLAVTMRFHLMRFTAQQNALSDLGEEWREAALRRVWRALPPQTVPVELERGRIIDRHLVKVDDLRDLHIIAATDPLDDWKSEIWGLYDSAPALERIMDLLAPSARQQYSTAEELVHIILVDSPGRGASWGLPDIPGADPILIMRSDDLQVLVHDESDELLGLILFGQAVARRPGRSMSFDIVDEFAAYTSHQQSFYLSDDEPPAMTHFAVGSGLESRLKHSREVDHHGVVVPRDGSPIVQVVRRYPKDAPEVFVALPGQSFKGVVVELPERQVFIGLSDETWRIGEAAGNLIDCVAFWVRECALLANTRPIQTATEITVEIDDIVSWGTLGDPPPEGPAVHFSHESSGKWLLMLTSRFASLLQHPTNAAEGELVNALLTEFLGFPAADAATMMHRVAPPGQKRMITAMSQADRPDMLARELPEPITGHEQVTAQLLDELGDWLRSASGAGLPVGQLAGKARTDALNAAVGHLFERLVKQVSQFGSNELLDFLVLHNESLQYSAKLDTSVLASRLACFGEHSDEVTDLVDHRTRLTTAHRANRFLIEYVAAQPPAGSRPVTKLDYYRLLAIAKEIIERGTTSDFLHHRIADFDVSILPSGRLGVSREEPVTQAMAAYARNAGARAIRDANALTVTSSGDAFDVNDLIARSEAPMRQEFGFSLEELREVCGGLLDMATADQVNRVKRSHAIANIASARGLAEATVATVISSVTLTARSSFDDIGQDAYPWRYSRDMSYVRRPIVLQGDELVFGFRSIYRLGPHWADGLMSGRLQSRARTVEMKQFISSIRRRINDDFVSSVADRLRGFGMPTQTNVWKVGKSRIVGDGGNDLGDIDVLSADTESRTLLAVEAKDFEISRTPVEIAQELEKLFVGSPKKKPTVTLHSERIVWLEHHIDDAMAQLGVADDPSKWRVTGLIVTSDPLVTPLMHQSPLPVVPFDDLTGDRTPIRGAKETRRPSPRKRKRRT